MFVAAGVRGVEGWGGGGAWGMETQCSSLWPCFLSFFCWLEMNCCFHCWQGPADLPPPSFWAPGTVDRPRWSAPVFTIPLCERGCRSVISSSSLQVPSQRSDTQGRSRAGEPFPETLDTAVRSLRLRFPCCLCAFAVLPQCWLSSLLLCLNKHRLGLG